MRMRRLRIGAIDIRLKKIFRDESMHCNRRDGFRAPLTRHIERVRDAAIARDRGVSPALVDRSGFGAGRRDRKPQRDISGDMRERIAAPIFVRRFSSEIGAQTGAQR